MSNIAIFDVNPMTTNTLKLMLEALGHSVVLNSNSIELSTVCANLKSAKPDFIILDETYTKQELTDCQLTTIQESLNSPIILTTNSSFYSIKNKWAELKISEVLQKPIYVDSLMLAIEKSEQLSRFKN